MVAAKVDQTDVEKVGMKVGKKVDWMVEPMVN
jgi:hypothetical protein